MSRKKYIIRRDEGLHLTDRQREILGTAWNQYVNRLVPISLRRRESLSIKRVLSNRDLVDYATVQPD